MDFTDRSPATAQCPGGDLAQLRTRMFVSKPRRLAEFWQDIPDSVRSHMDHDEKVHEFQFRTDPADGNLWGLSGYLVARDDCIVHVQVNGYGN